MGAYTSRLVETIVRFGLDNRYAAALAWRRQAEMGVMDERTAEMLLLTQVQRMIEAVRLSQNFLPRPPELEDLAQLPEIVIGHLLERENVPIGISLSGAVHCVIAGKSGSGKTVEVRRVIRAVEKRNRMGSKPVVIIVLDPKGDYVDLPTLYGSHWRHYDYHSTLRIGFNPPAGVPFNVWINCIATTVCARMRLIASRVAFANAIRHLVAVMNKGNSGPVRFPSLYQIYQFIRRLPQKALSGKTQYDEALRNAHEGWLPATGDLFRTENGLDLERDLISKGQSAVIHMPAVEPPEVAACVIDLLVSQLLVGRSFRGHRVDQLEVLLIIDEADDAVSWHNEQYFGGAMSPISTAFKKLREFGVGIVVSVGALNPVSQHVLNNAEYCFLFRMGDDACAEKARRTLQIPERCRGMFKGLQPGQCIARTPASPEAVLAQIDYIEPCRTVPGDFDVNPHIPDRPIDDMPEVLEEIKRLSGEYRHTEARRKRAQYGGLSPKARELVMAASLRPFVPVARLYDEIGAPSAAKQRAIREELTANQYAEMVELRVGRRNLLLIELLEAAQTLLGKPPVKLKGRGGLAHRHVAAWIELVGKMRGYEADTEWVVPHTNHPVDAVWINEGSNHVFECVTGCSENIGDHVRAAFLVSGDVVSDLTIVAPEKQKLDGLRCRIESVPEFAVFLDRVHFAPVGDFLKELGW